MEITFQYSNVSWNAMMQKANLVFTKIFNILTRKLAVVQNSFHSCRPLLDFFVQIMVFHNAIWISFKLTLKNLTKILLSSVAYRTTFDMTCPKHDPTNGHANWNVEQETTKINVEVKVFKLNLSFWCMQLLCQVSQGIQQQFYLVCHGYTRNVVYFKNPNCHMTWHPWGIDETHNNSEGIKAHTRHPKVKWACTSNTRYKGRDDTNLFSFIHHVREHFNHHLATEWKL